MFFNYRSSVFQDLFLYPAFSIAMITWVYMCANTHFVCEVAYYITLVLMSVYYLDKCLDSYFNGELMRKDRIIGNYDSKCTSCDKNLCENFLFLQYVHGSCTPFNCPTTRNCDPPEASSLKRQPRRTNNSKETVVNFTPKHRYCNDCLPRYINMQSGNRQAVCRACNAALDPSNIPPRNRFWLQKTLVFTLQALSFVILYVDKVYQKGYFTNAQ